MNEINVFLHATCSAVPSSVLSPFGLGMMEHWGDICGSVISEGLVESNNWYHETRTARKIFERADAAQNDCIGAAAAFARVVCDLHCVKDAIQSGNLAVRQSLEQAVAVLNRNFDLLTEYSTEKLTSKLDALKDELSDLSPDAAGDGLDLQGIRQSLNSRLARLHKLLSFGRLSAAGRSSSERALRSFMAGLEPSRQSNASRNLQHLIDKEEMLHGALLSASGQGLERGSHAVAEEVTTAARAMETLSRSRNHLLGVYHHRSEEWKQRQRKQRAAIRLRDDTTAWLLVELDSTWWQLRAAFDKYLTQAKSYSLAFSDAVKLLQSYISCSIQFVDLRAGWGENRDLDFSLNAGFGAFQKVEALHGEALQEAWSAMIPLAGLLVSKVLDSRAMTKLSKEDSETTLALGMSSESCGSFDAELGLLWRAFETKGAAPQDPEVLEQLLDRAREALEERLAVRRVLAERMRPQLCGNHSAWISDDGTK
eukprot:s4302_g1.t5